MNWLVGHFSVLGVEIQNWISVVSFIFALWMFCIIAMEPSGGSDSKNPK
jgi:hypothetical protein